MNDLFSDENIAKRDEEFIDKVGAAIHSMTEDQALGRILRELYCKMLYPEKYEE